MARIGRGIGFLERLAGFVRLPISPSLESTEPLRHRLIDNVGQVFRARESLESFELLPQRGVRGELNLVTLWRQWLDRFDWLRNRNGRRRHNCVSGLLLVVNRFVVGPRINCFHQVR